MCTAVADEKYFCHTLKPFTFPVPGAGVILPYPPENVKFMHKYFPPEASIPAA